MFCVSLRSVCLVLCLRVVGFGFTPDSALGWGFSFPGVFVGVVLNFVCVVVYFMGWSLASVSFGRDVVIFVFGLVVM